jgi:PAS domain S-box-containing protein
MIKQVAYDYTFWDDFVENINKGDTAWYNNNISTILKSFHIDYACVYDTNFNLVHEAFSDGCVAHGFITDKNLYSLRDKRFLTFFQVTADGLIEISGATVHGNNDPSHMLTKPNGYLFLAKNWNPDFLHELALLSGAKIDLLKRSDDVSRNVPYSISVVKKLSDWNGNNVAQIVFTRNSNAFRLYHLMSVFMMLIFLGSIITTLLVFHVSMRKWINKPLTLITGILKSGSLKQIEELQRCSGEFSDIGVLFSQFINQKDELCQAKEEAQESESELKNILDNSPFHIWTFNGEKYDYVNKAYADYIGINSAAAGQMDAIMWRKHVHPDDLEQSRTIWIEAWNKRMEHDNYFRLLHKNGYYRDFWCHAVPIFDNEGKLKQYLGFNIDITARKQAEKEIQELNEDLELRVKYRTADLEASNKELETFSYSVSHDLKAPLRHINGFIGLLLDNRSTELNEEELGFLEKITASASEMERLIDAILSFSRLNQTELRKTLIRSSDMVDHVIRFFEPEMQNRKITFNVGFLPDINGDEELILQVWTNLISNAIKYTGKKPEALIDIGSISTETDTTFFVKDNGAGFNMKYAEKLFGVFQRLHKSRDFEGIGIGLANVNRIVNRHGGRCRAEGQPDQGATFFFSLPN